MCIRNRNPPYTDVRRHGRNELSKRKWQNHDEKVPSLVMSFFSSPDERQKWSQKYRSCQQLYHRHCHRVREIWKHQFSDDVVTSTTQIPHHTYEGDLHKVYVCRPIHLELKHRGTANRSKRERWCWLQRKVRPKVVCNLSCILFIRPCSRRCLICYPSKQMLSVVSVHVAPRVYTSGYQKEMCTLHTHKIWCRKIQLNLQAKKSLWRNKSNVNSCDFTQNIIV